MQYKSFSIPVEMRFRDLDAYGHVNHAEFFTYIETARVKLMEDVLDQGLGDDNPLYVVVEATCRYREFLMLRRVVTVVIDIENMKRTRFDLRYKITDGAERVFAEARTTMVCINPATNRPMPIPEHFQACLRVE